MLQTETYQGEDYNLRAVCSARTVVNDGHFQCDNSINMSQVV